MYKVLGQCSRCHDEVMKENSTIIVEGISKGTWREVDIDFDLPSNKRIVVRHMLHQLD